MASVKDSEIRRETNISIPTIYIENRRCSESPNFVESSPFFNDENETLNNNRLPFSLQISQFFCWFAELAESKQFILAAMILKNLQIDHLNIIQLLVSHRLSKYKFQDIVNKANDYDYISNLNTYELEPFLVEYLLKLLPHFQGDSFKKTPLNLEPSCSVKDTEVIPVLPSSENKINDVSLPLQNVYLNLVDKALRQTVQAAAPASSSQPRLVTNEDVFETPEGQVLLLLLSNPSFGDKEKAWLSSNLKNSNFSQLESAFDDVSALTKSDDLITINRQQNLSDFATDLSEALSLDFGFVNYDQQNESHTRSNSISTQYPLFSRTSFSSTTKRHHSLIPTNSAENDMYKSSSPFNMTIPPWSNASMNSSGFISGSDSIYQGLSQSGTSETASNGVSTYGSHLSTKAPSTRLHPSNINQSFNPNRRQSASPYAFQFSAKSMTEVNETTSIIESTDHSPISIDSVPLQVSVTNSTCNQLPQMHPTKNSSSSFSSDNQNNFINSDSYLKLVSMEKCKTSISQKNNENEISSPRQLLNPCFSIPQLSVTAHSPTVEFDDTSESRLEAKFHQFNLHNGEYVMELSSSVSSSLPECQSPIEPYCLPVSVPYFAPPSIKGPNCVNASKTSLCSAIENPQTFKDSNRDEIKRDCLVQERKNNSDNLFIEPASGMGSVPIWLKSLRLHKYVGLFQQLTYQQMLNITDEWLLRKHVTQGARNKILVSIKNLSQRSLKLNHIENKLLIASTSFERQPIMLSCFSELRCILQTPLLPFSGQSCTGSTNKKIHDCQLDDVVLSPISPIPAASSEPSPNSSFLKLKLTDVHQIDVDDELEEDLFMRNMSEDEFGDEEDNTETINQNTFFPLKLVHQTGRQNADTDITNVSLSRCSFVNSDSCLHQTNNANLHLSCTESTSRPQSSENVFYYPSNVNKDCREYGLMCRRNSDSIVGDVFQSKHKVTSLQSQNNSTYYCQGFEKDIKSTFTANHNKFNNNDSDSCKTNTIANFIEDGKNLLFDCFQDASDSENLQNKILRCIFQGFSLLISGFNEDPACYRLFNQLLTMIADNSAFSIAQKGLCSSWQRKLLNTLGQPPPPYCRNTRPSRRPSQYPPLQIRGHGVNRYFSSHPFPPGPHQQRINTLTLPGFTNHHSLSPIRPCSTGYSLRDKFFQKKTEFNSSSLKLPRGQSVGHIFTDTSNDIQYDLLPQQQKTDNSMLHKMCQVTDNSTVGADPVAFSNLLPPIPPPMSYRSWNTSPYFEQTIEYSQMIPISSISYHSSDQINLNPRSSTIISEDESVADVRNQAGIGCTVTVNERKGNCLPYPAPSKLDVNQFSHLRPNDSNFSHFALQPQLEKNDDNQINSNFLYFGKPDVNLTDYECNIKLNTIDGTECNKEFQLDPNVVIDNVLKPPAMCIFSSGQTRMPPSFPSHASNVDYSYFDVALNFTNANSNIMNQFEQQQLLQQQQQQQQPYLNQINSPPDSATDEINRNLDLLTRDVTNLAIGESDSQSN